MSHEMAISIMSAFPRVGQAACGNQFESAQFGQGVPKTAFSCSMVVQHAKEIDGMTG
jgi:hypothetical protein